MTLPRNIKDPVEVYRNWRIYENRSEKAGTPISEDTKRAIKSLKGRMSQEQIDEGEKAVQYWHDNLEAAHDAEYGTLG